jgi:hypothetical protein
MKNFVENQIYGCRLEAAQAELLNPDKRVKNKKIAGISLQSHFLVHVMSYKIS